MNVNMIKENADDNQNECSWMCQQKRLILLISYIDYVSYIIMMDTWIAQCDRC